MRYHHYGGLWLRFVFFDPPTSGRGTGSGGGWTDIAAQVAGGVFLGAENGVVFYGFDSLAHPNEPVDLTARLRKAKTLGEIEGVTVGFFDGDRTLGSARTDDEGVAVVPWTPPGVGNYSLTARIIAPGNYNRDILDTSAAPLLVMVRGPQTKFVVIDLDHTLVDASFFKVLLGGGRPMASSIAVTTRIARRYDIIYLTHRPDLMTSTSKKWLRRYGYPMGPLLVSTMREALGSSGKYKTRRIATVQKLFPRIEIGIGDKISDAIAYVNNGLEAYLIPHYPADNPDRMREVAHEIRQLKKYREKLQVVDGWPQIEQGIFAGKRFPPTAFAHRLDTRAATVEREKKNRQHRKK